MTEIPRLGNMGSDNLGSNCETGEKISVSDHVNGLQSDKSESFVVEMERFSHLIENDINANSRITRNLSRKGSGRAGEKTIIGNDRDITMLATSPRATLHGGSSTPEKPAVVALGATDHSIIPQVHHQITITSRGTVSSAAAGESKSGGKRFSFRRPPPTFFYPRRILLFFATLSCLGTMVLIYFTLSMGKLNGDENDLN